MATLDLNFKNVYTKVSEYLGLGSPTTNTTELVTVKDIVRRGYRKFLMPMENSNIVAERKKKRVVPSPYRWSFLRQTTTLATADGVDTYELPTGYNGMIIPLKHTTPDSPNPKEVPLSTIYQRKSETTGESYPLYFAIKQGDFNKFTGRSIEIIFSPTPDGTYTYYYTYRLMPDAPVEDDDYFVGPVGSSEAILECSLAVAELQEKDRIGIHQQLADQLVQQLIGDDKLNSLVGNIGGSEPAYRRTATIYDDDDNQLIPD